MRTAALILAGGSATRMGGGDKPLLEVGGVPMLARIIDTLRRDTPAIAISANGDPTRFAMYGLPVLPDGPFPGQGPLAGVLAGLCWAAAIGADALLTIPGDTPFVPAGLATALAPPPACAAANGLVHHLIALWPVACQDTLHSLLCTPGHRAVARFADTIGLRRVDFPTAKWDPFLNVNTPDDLAVARSLSPQAEEGQI